MIKRNRVNDLSRRDEILSVACMAHIRRKFHEALDQDKARSSHILKQIGNLYLIERFCRNMHLSSRERKELRGEHSKLIMEQIKTSLITNRDQVLPKSAIGKAINYAIGQWPRMENYLLDGRIEIDNNLVENAIRPIALGRKNYLFAGSHNGASNAAIIYSLVASAKLNGLNPFIYLRDVLSRISDYRHKQLADLLPQNWKEPESESQEPGT